MVGNGAALSGGQKTRIVLARALYQDKRMYLLDNVLADINPVLSEEILKRMFNDLLRDKSVILSTSSPERYLNYFDADISVVEREDFNTIKASSLGERKLI